MSHNQSEAARAEQIISQFLLKTLQSVLAARIPHLAGGASGPSGAARLRRHDRWFNLAIGSLPPALENLGFLHQGAMDPIIVDIILSRRDNLESVSVVERWIAQCDRVESSSSTSLYSKTYKKSILLLRSIYCLLRLLPAYRAFRLISSSSSQSSNYDLSYKVSSIAEPFSREEERGFKLHTFPFVESQLGNLCVSVLYRPTLENFNLEVCSLLAPMIITDYVGSPAADPMRAFPADPICYPLRPHSWTTTAMAHHPLHAIPRQSGHRKGSFSFEEYRLSPPFSASPTPSPPTHAGNAFQSRLRSETAPVSIPVMGKNQLHRTQNFSEPTRSLLPPPSPRSARADVCLEESPSSRSFRKAGDLHSLLYAAPKVLKDARDDSGRFSSALSSCGSPRFGFSRSSSRKSVQDDLEDIDFSCPFAVDDVDASESQSRNYDTKDASESAQTSPQKSQDAAVGALVHMLKTAPSLRQDHSISSQSSKSEMNSEASSSSFFSPRTKSDALEELKRYKDMKETILSKSRIQMPDPEK